MVRAGHLAFNKITMLNQAIAFLTSCFLSISSFAQISDSEPVFRHPTGKGFATVVKENMNYRRYQNSCTYRSGFVRFNIDSIGRVDSLYISQSIPDTLRDCLRLGFKAAEGHWAPAIKNGKATYSKPMLLPVTIMLEGGCRGNFGVQQDRTAMFQQWSFGDLRIKKDFSCTLLYPLILNIKYKMEMSDPKKEK
jgi:hypothetical protein